MKLLYWLVDCINVILTTLAESFLSSRIAFVLFLPFLALVIPFMIYYSERERKGKKLDYPH